MYTKAGKGKDKKLPLVWNGGAFLERVDSTNSTKSLPEKSPKDNEKSSSNELVIITNTRMNIIGRGDWGGEVLVNQNS